MKPDLPLSAVQTIPARHWRHEVIFTGEAMTPFEDVILRLLVDILPEDQLSAVAADAAGTWRVRRIASGHGLTFHRPDDRAGKTDAGSSLRLIHADIRLAGWPSAFGAVLAPSVRAFFP